MWSVVGTGCRNVVYKYSPKNGGGDTKKNITTTDQPDPNSGSDLCTNSNKFERCSEVDLRNYTLSACNQNSLIGLVLRVPKPMHLDLLFCPILYRSLVASYIFPCINEVEASCPKAISVSDISDSLMDLFYAQTTENNRGLSPRMYIIPDSLLNCELCVELKVLYYIGFMIIAKIS